MVSGPFANLGLQNLGSIFRHPYQFNGTIIHLGITLKTDWNIKVWSKHLKKLYSSWINLNLIKFFAASIVIEFVVFFYSSPRMIFSVWNTSYLLKTIFLCWKNSSVTIYNVNKCDPKMLNILPDNKKAWIT